MSISVWLRDREQRQSMGPLPEAVELHLIPSTGAPPPGILDAEFLVPPYDSQPVLGLLAQMPRLSPLTRHLMDDRMLSQMRSGALLVNASRGAVIDTDALVAHLGAGHIRAALDVTDPEPLPREHPLWDAPGLLITPHLAGDSPQAEHRVYRFIGEQIRRYANGEPLRNVIVAGGDSGSSQQALS